MRTSLLDLTRQEFDANRIRNAVLRDYEPHYLNVYLRLTQALRWGMNVPDPKKHRLNHKSLIRWRVRIKPPQIPVPLKR